MDTHLSRSWSWILWRGILSLVFGLVALRWPGAALLGLPIFFGAYALGDGSFAIAVALQRGERTHRWLLLFDGIVGMGLGVSVLITPMVTLGALLAVIGLRAIVVGLLQIAAAVQLRLPQESKMLIGVGGASSIMLGIMLLAFPATTSLAIPVFIGVNALVFGTMMLALSARLRGEIPALSPFFTKASR